MEENIKFSILVPAFKVQFLVECIDSVLSQTYTDFELIIVNDASPENLGEIVSSYNDSRIRYYVNEKNCGAINVVDNWNICLNYAKGDYVICMGDDDKLLPCCLEEYNKLIHTYPGLSVYHAWTEIIDEHSNIINLQEPRPSKEGIYSMMWWRWNGRIQFIGDYLFDRQKLLRNGGFYKLPLAWASDDISIYIAAKDTGIANMQIPGFQYRANSQTISSTGNVMFKLDAILQEEDWYKSFLSTIPDTANEIEYVCWNLLRTHLPIVMRKKRVYTLSNHIQNNGLSCVLSFLRHSKYYKLNIMIIAYAIIKSLKRTAVRKIL